MKGKVRHMKLNLQFFGSTGVNPVNAMEFGVNTSGRTGNTSTIVKDAESLSISIDGNVEEWDAMDAAGWKRRLMTAKSLSISMGGKRNYGDPGNDYSRQRDLRTSMNPSLCL